jgi:hypothetical protein
MTFSILIAAALAQSPVLVVPADLTAQFKGDGGALKFDTSCRDYTLETVKSDPLCAERVAKAEAGPVLAIVAKTLQAVPAKKNEALLLLKRSATATDSPAVHYLLGSVLGSGKVIQPDYGLAVRHLSIAAERKNPAAADLLANLLIAGKGAPRDVSRAIRLYEFAAANGFPYSALSLGKLYLAGKFVAKDEARGRAWLDAAAAVNTPSAAELAELAKAQDRINNYQLIPAADPKDVKVERYGTFDNPDIPPNFGFDTAFQAMRDAPYDDPEILAGLQRDFGTLPTPYLYELARRLAAKDAAKSLTMFLVARTRMIYDASRCADPAAFESLQAWDMLTVSEFGFLFAFDATTPAIVNAAIAEEKKLPADTSPWWVCRSGMASITATMSGNAGPLKLKPTAQWQELRREAQMQLSGLVPAR